jgi:hypothetical protein
VHVTNLPDCVIDSIIFTKWKNFSDFIIRQIPDKDKPLKRTSGSPHPAGQAARPAAESEQAAVILY